MKCSRCGATDRPTERHHITPFCYGGGDEPDNMADLCSPCHHYFNVRQKLQEDLENYRKRNDQYGRQMAEVYAVRLAKLDELNAPDIIRSKGTYESYYGHTTTAEREIKDRYYQEYKKQKFSV